MAIWPFAMKSGQDVAQRGRLALSGLWMPARDAPLKTFSGFVDDGGGVVTVNVGAMTVNVSAFRAIVQPANSAQGAYPVVLDAAQTITLPNGGGSPVPTTIAAIVEDSAFDLSGVQQARLLSYPTSTPPTAGTVIPLRAFTLRAGVSAGTGGLLNTDLGADLRKFAVANGGVLPCLSTDRPTNPNDGRIIYETDTDRVMTYNGTTWIDIFGAAFSTYAVVWSQTGGTVLSIGSGSLTGRFQKKGRKISGSVLLVRAADTNTGSNSYVFSLPEDAVDFRLVQGVGFTTRGANDYPITVRGLGASAVALVMAGQPGTRLSFNQPAGPTTGDQIWFGFEYQSAA